jgi:glutamine cyclotransferase
MMLPPLRRIVRRALRKAWFAGVPRYVPRILRVLPHDREAFTQGLAYLDGMLFESTGRIGRSALRAISAADGKLLKSVAVPDVWAEGLAVQGDRIVQLTWKHGVANVYGRDSFERIGQLRYPGEGWGLSACNDGFVMTDGSANLWFRDGEFLPTRRVPVSLKGMPVARLNDVIWADNRIFANILYASEIVELHPRTGSVIGFVDCSALLARVGVSDSEHVLNGIAHDPDSGSFFLTGKCWPELFEVTFERTE